jgi:hypothetical protein
MMAILTLIVFLCGSRDRVFVDLFHSITKQVCLIIMIIHSLPYSVPDSKFPQPTRRLNLMHLEDVFHRNMLMSSKDCFGRDELLGDLQNKIKTSDKIITGILDSILYSPRIFILLDSSPRQTGCWENHSYVCLDQRLSKAG